MGEAFYENEMNYTLGFSETRYSPTSTKISKAEIDLMNNMRMLWEQHGVWTRSAITSILLNLPDVDLVTKRLLRNPKDFQIALQQFYGNENASKFGDLLKDHLVIASEIVKAAKNGDENAVRNAEKRWYENADEIAVLFSSINPYWSKEEWQRMLYRHLQLVKAEALDILNKNYEQGIVTYDEIEKQALEMADMMTQGIVKQFPNKFI